MRKKGSAGGSWRYCSKALGSNQMSTAKNSPSPGVLRVGVGGPVGSGKTALVEALCRRLSGRYRLAVVINKIDLAPPGRRFAYGNG